MKLEKIDAIVARRVFEATDGREIEIIIGVPQPFPGCDDDYFCPIQINGLGDPWISYAGGIDSYQALVLGLKKLSARLLNREEVKRGEVQWLDGSDPALGLLSGEGAI
jgi:hypothetical protein